MKYYDPNHHHLKARFSKASESEGSRGNVLIKSGDSIVASSGAVKVESAAVGTIEDTGMPTPSTWRPFNMAKR